MLKNFKLDHAAVQERLTAAFDANGIPKSRLTMKESAGGQRHHFQMYNEIDIALDPFPYAGTTTTCDALYMSVPVIT